MKREEINSHSRQLQGEEGGWKPSRNQTQVAALAPPENKTLELETEPRARALAALAEDPGPFPAHTKQLTTFFLYASSKAAGALFWPPRALYTFGTQTTVQAYTYTHKQK